MSDIDYTQIPLGANPSPDDPRDFPITKLIPTQLTEFPQEFILPYNHEVKNQGQINSCVAHSLAYCREITQEIQDKEYKQFSVGFIYGNRSDTDYQGTGWHPREALNHILKEGVCDYNSFPYNEEYPSVKDKLIQNKDALLKNAYPNRISAYARIYTLNDIKSALIQLKSPVTFIMKITPSFYNISRYNPVFTPPTSGSESLYGFHELTCTGYKQLNSQEVLVVLNSWGSSWGDNGYFYIPTKLLNTQGYYFVEFWSITDEIVPGGEKMELRPCSIKYVDIHHTAGHEENTEAVRQEHLALGWGDIGYNTVIESNGTVGIGRDVKWSGSHNPGLAPDGSGYTMNQRAYAISHIGNFDDDFISDVQFNSSIKKCVEVCKQFNIVPSTETIRRHKDDYPTDCPGSNFPYDRYVSEVVKLYNQGDENQVEKAILIFGQDDLPTVKRLMEKIGNIPVIFRNSDATAPSSIQYVKQLFVVGGKQDGSDVNHPNKVVLAGADWFATADAVANYIKTH